MKKRWLVLTVVSSLLFILAGCGKTVEEQISSGVDSVESTFNEQEAESNNSFNDIELYLPDGYSIEKTDDVHNYIIQKGKNQYILFVNQNENRSSKVHYNVLKNDQTKKIIEEKTFELDGAFGFVVIVEVDESTYELIVGSGAAKISTISEDSKMDEKLADMMLIAHSVKEKK